MKNATPKHSDQLVQDLAMIARNAIECIRDLEAKQHNGLQIPKGYALVPIEPTEAMLKAMDECATEGYDERLLAGIASSVYRAALDEAPQCETEQAMRLYKAVERLSLQAGEETSEAVDWLCGEHGGMFKLYEAYFSPKSPKRKPLSGYINAAGIDANDSPYTVVEKLERAIEAAHGIKGEA